MNPVEFVAPSHVTCGCEAAPGRQWQVARQIFAMSCPAIDSINGKSLRDFATCSCWRSLPILTYHRIGPSINMAPRLNPWGACRSLVSCSRPRVQTQLPSIATTFARHLSSQPPASNTPTGSRASIPPIPPSMLPPGELSWDAQEEAPSTDGNTQSSRLSPQEAAIQHLELSSEGINSFEYTGLKFEDPPMPMAKLHEAHYHMRYRYDEGISQITRLLMRDGKLSKAQAVSHIFLLVSGNSILDCRGKHHRELK